MITFTAHRVLVLAPHADDETFGCAGIIQKFVKAGSLVHILVFSFVHGEHIKYDKSSENYRTYSAQERLDEFHAVMIRLGVASHEILFNDYPGHINYHHKLDKYSISDILPAIEERVRITKPSVVLVPAVSKNQDHTFVNQLARTLARPYFCDATFLGYEVDGELNFTPSLFVPLSEEEVQQKIALIKLYRTQDSGSNHPTAVRKQVARMEMRGGDCYQPYAEAFEVIRIISSL